MTHAPISPAPATDATGYGRWEGHSVLAALIVTTVTLNLCIQPIGQVADPIRKAFGIDDVQFSFLLSALVAIPSTLMSVAGGWLADKVSRRRLLLAALLTCTMGALLCALAGSYTQLAIGRLVIATAAGMHFPLAMSWASDAYSAARRGRAVGALFVIFGIAPAISASITGLVLGATEGGHLATLPLVGHLEPWRAALLVLALTSVPFLPWVATLRDDRPVRLAEAASSIGPKAAFPLVFAVSMMAVTALLALADTANLAWLPTVLRRQYGFAAEQVGFTFALMTTIGGSLGPITAGFVDGWVFKRWGNAGRLAACGAAACISAPLLMAFTGNSSHVLLTSLVCSSVASMAAMTLAYTCIQSLLPSGQRGLGSGIANAANTLASASAPTAVAFIAGASTGAGALGNGIAAVTVSAFVLTAVLSFACARGAARRFGPQATAASPESVAMAV
jgi:MFS family permease